MNKQLESISGFQSYDIDSYIAWSISDINTFKSHLSQCCVYYTYFIGNIHIDSGCSSRHNECSLVYSECSLGHIECSLVYSECSSGHSECSLEPNGCSLVYSECSLGQNSSQYSFRSIKSFFQLAGLTSGAYDWLFTSCPGLTMGNQVSHSQEMNVSFVVRAVWTTVGP